MKTTVAVLEAASRPDHLAGTRRSSDPRVGVTISWVRVADMGAMPGTMGMSLLSFVVMWGLMMAAMMLPSVAPFVLSYRATLVDHRATRLTALGLGYLLIWTAVGVLAYFVADWFGALASDRPNVAQGVAVGTFALVGLFQLTPLKFRCLSHCRSPLGHLCTTSVSPADSATFGQVPATVGSAWAAAGH